ncbi:DUF2207 domain-containing protein [Enemella sp. A6]|uniref:DUF2207 domain-containing protein n=1 Tax=Enemella sp. A6 TaxID=3440152 RepID=UPI003EC07CEE
MRRLFAILLTALVCLGWAQQAARADSNWQITRYDMQMVAERDGAINVTLEFDFDFGNERGHGPVLALPNRMEVADDPDRWRVLEISNIQASSPSGAPAQVARSGSGGVIEVRIGDENRYVRGVQTYVVTFTVEGVVNPDVNGRDEIAWDAIGGFELPISNATVSLEGPDEVVESECVAGERGTSTPCTDEQVTDNRVVWSQDRVETGDGMTVVAAFPGGTFPGAEPRFTKRYHLGNTLVVNEVTGGVSGAVALLGVGGVALLARRRGRDRAWANLPPGLTPDDPRSAQVVTRDKRAPVAVQFTPPKGLRPAEVGTLMAERAEMKEVSATLIDLAVRGYLQIQEEPNDRKRLIKLRNSDGLAPFEKAVFHGVFARKDQPLLHKIKTMPDIVSKTKFQLDRAVTDAGWFRGNPTLVRTLWYVLGVAVTIGGVGLGLLLGLAAGWGLFGVAIALIGLAIIGTAHVMPARTPQGSAMLAQAKGFELYLTTAEADQLRFEEGEDIFSKYLPYAIVFGVAERWTRVCTALAAEGRMNIDTGWYVGPYVMFSHPAAFAGSMAGLSDSMTSAMTSAVASSAASAGGSGFGGGVGGGIGGVGGGGW